MHLKEEIPSYVPACGLTYARAPVPVLSRTAAAQEPPLPRNSERRIALREIGSFPKLLGSKEWELPTGAIA